MVANIHIAISGPIKDAHS